VRFKKLPNETRNLLGYLVEVRACGFGILVQSNPLLDPSNCGESKGDRFNLQPQQFLDKLSGNAGAKQHQDDHCVEQVLNLGHALGAVVKASLDAFVPAGANGFMDAQTLVRFCGKFMGCFHLSLTWGFFFWLILGFVLQSLNQLKHLLVGACSKIGKDVVQDWRGDDQFIHVFLKWLGWFGRQVLLLESQLPLQAPQQLLSLVQTPQQAQPQPLQALQRLAQE